VESRLGPLGTSATEWPVVPAPGDYDDGEFGGMKIGMGNRSTRRKPAPAPLCPPQIPLDQTRVQTRAAAVVSQRLTAWAMARPKRYLVFFTESRPVLGVTHFPIQWILVFVSLVIMQMGCETDYSQQSNVQTKNMWIHTSTPQLSSWPRD
jgi:hypothetical protein